MVNEYPIIWQSAVAGLSAIIVATLYSLGGRAFDGGKKGYKWLRRYLASFILCLSFCLLALWRGNFSFWFLLIFPLFVGIFSLGYGSDVLWIKLLKRSIIAVASVAVGVALMFILGGRAGLALIPHAGLAAWSVYMGVKNPFPAAAEEFIISMLLSGPIYFYLFI